MASDTSSPGTRTEKRRRGRKTLARKLYVAASVLPPAVRRELRDYLVEHGDLEPRRRKIHSWKRKAKPRGRLVKPAKREPRRQAEPDPQLPLPIDI